MSDPEHTKNTPTNGGSPAADGRIRVGEHVTIRKRGKRGTYVAEFWHDGQHRRRSLKTASLPHARQKASRLDDGLCGGGYAAPPKPAAIEVVVKEYVEVKKGEDKSSKTLTKYRQWLDCFRAFAADANVRTLQQVTPSLFERYRAFRKPGLAPKTLYTGLVIVKSFLKWCAVPGRYLPQNPVAGCKVDEPYVAPKYTPTRKQVRAIVNAATGDRKAQYALLAYSGLRRRAADAAAEGRGPGRRVGPRGGPAGLGAEDAAGP